MRKLELSGGPPLHFDGPYRGYLGYQILIGISFLTIIGWGWAIASYYRWVAENTHGKGIAIRCDAEGWDVLWRTVVAIIGSIPLLTIPLMCMWYVRWLVSTIALTRGVTDTSQEWA